MKRILWVVVVLACSSSAMASECGGGACRVRVHRERTVCKTVEVEQCGTCVRRAPVRRAIKHIIHGRCCR